MTSVNELKDLGNKAFSEKQYSRSIDYFSKAIEQDPNNHVLYSNRSASHAAMREYEKALEDAERVVTLKPDWPRGYGRKGAALMGLGDFDEAINTYKQGLDIDPENASLKRGLEETEAAKNQGSSGLKQMFSNPKALERLTLDPETRGYLSDPTFMQAINDLQKDPSNMQMHLQDPRVMKAISVMLGINMQFQQPETSSHPPKNDTHSTSTAKPSPPSPPPQPKKDETPVTDEDKKKLEAEEEKKIGNDFYKRKQFDEAIQHYTKAWELDPSNIAYLTNRSAAYFEKGDFDNCISDCKQAVEVGREVKADFKLIARALARIGSCYEKQKDWQQAKHHYEKSLTESRNPEVFQKLQGIEKIIQTEAQLAYQDPELALKEKEIGNEFFKQQNYPKAVEHYTESIKRNPADPKVYCNRASAYIKLLALPEALKDCEKALSIDPNFVKAHIRKANIEFYKKEYHQCLETLAKAEELDSDKLHTKEIDSQKNSAYQAIMNSSKSTSREETLQNALKDPEVASILSDPVMRSILEQAQSNPMALQEHLKNPHVKAKIMKLIDAGVLSVGR